MSRTKPIKPFEPPRSQVLALAMLANVDPRTARKALIYGTGAVGGDAGHRVAIAMNAMAPVEVSVEQRMIQSMIAGLTPAQAAEAIRDYRARLAAKSRAS